MFRFLFFLIKITNFSPTMKFFLLFFSFIHITLANVPTSNFFPFGLSNGDDSLSRGDDNFSPTVYLDQNFYFFGRKYTELWLNTNGAMSFATQISEYTPTCAPLNVTFSMVAPFWYVLGYRFIRLVHNY